MAEVPRPEEAGQRLPDSAFRYLASCRVQSIRWLLRLSQEEAEAEAAVRVPVEAGGGVDRVVGSTPCLVLTVS